MISYDFVPISSQKGVLFLRHPVYIHNIVTNVLCNKKHPEDVISTSFRIT